MPICALNHPSRVLQESSRYHLFCLVVPVSILILVKQCLLILGSETVASVSTRNECGATLRSPYMEFLGAR